MSPVGQILAQSGLVEFPVAVFAAVEQNHRQPVAELGPQAAVAFLRFGVDVGGRQVEVEFLGELLELRVDPVANRAAGAGQQLDLAAAHGFSVAVRFICRGFGWIHPTVVSAGRAVTDCHGEYRNG
jgi:hypothetical protein